MLEKHEAADVDNVDNGGGGADSAPDPTDLAMLGIDPDDLAGFGN